MSKRAAPRMAEEELQKLVRGLVTGQVMTSHYVINQDPDSLGTVFLPLTFGALDDYDPTTISCVYEWMDQAGSGINGLPIFTSMKLCHVDDWPIIAERTKKAKAALDAAAAGS